MLIDSHCHLDFEDFDSDRDAVLARARARGIGRFVTISTRVRRFGELRAIVERERDVYCSIGTHPHNADEELGINVDELIRIAEHPKVVAVGEAGLDYHYHYSTPANQAAGLRVHIEAARETGLPVVIHARNADDDMAALLKEEAGKGAYPAVLHCFSSGRDLAMTGISLGFYVSFSGILTFKNSEEIRAIAAELPMDRLLVETDAPYLAPPPHRGKRNEPAFVADTAAVLAQVRGVSTDEIARVTTDNFFRLFSKVPRELAP
jgi:TatD DNase family protein